MMARSTRRIRACPTAGFSAPAGRPERSCSTNAAKFASRAPARDAFGAADEAGLRAAWSDLATCSFASPSGRAILRTATHGMDEPTCAHPQDCAPSASKCTPSRTPGARIARSSYGTGPARLQATARCSSRAERRQTGTRRPASCTWRFACASLASRRRAVAWQQACAVAHEDRTMHATVVVERVHFEADCARSRRRCAGPRGREKPACRGACAASDRSEAAPRRHASARAARRSRARPATRMRRCWRNAGGPPRRSSSVPACNSRVSSRLSAGPESCN